LDEKADKITRATNQRTDVDLFAVKSEKGSKNNPPKEKRTTESLPEFAGRRGRRNIQKVGDGIKKVTFSLTKGQTAEVCHLIHLGGGERKSPSGRHKSGGRKPKN